MSKKMAKILNDMFEKRSSFAGWYQRGQELEMGTLICQGEKRGLK